MDHALAKQLKDAAFPQECKQGAHLTPEGLFSSKPQADTAYAPTLEELIEACRPTEEVGIVLNVIGSRSAAQRLDLIGEGRTPTEAVARLWLALSAKAV